MLNNDLSWIFQFLGRLHPLVVHFPIALLIVAAFFELLTLSGKRNGLREGIRWLVYLGTLSALVATAFGWLLQSSDEYSGSLVQSHQNFGIATAVLALLSAFLLYLSQRKESLRKPYQALLLASVGTLTVAGHLGANLTHGEDYLTSTFPGSDEHYDRSEFSTLLAELRPQDSLSLDQQDELNLKVRGILAHNCYQCHSDLKQKGDLVLETEDGMMAGGESGVVVIPGKAEESELVRRITLPTDHDEVMPKKGKVLKPEEIALIKLWIDRGAHWADAQLKVFPEAELALSQPALPPSDQEISHPIDRIVNDYFNEQDTNWPEVVDDRTFIRRAYLDIVGLLPPPSAVSEFIRAPFPNKREELIDELLADSHNYTQHWLSFWNDLLRNDYSGTGFITGGRRQITGWLYNALLENKPYEQMVRELADPTEESEGFIKGIRWRGVVNASQTTEMQAAQNIGQSLMGLNLKCASCHNSFVSNLTLSQAYNFASIFADSTLELYRCDKPTGKMAQVSFVYPELGAIDAETLEARLEQLAEVLVTPENGRLYRTMTNRIWERLLGRGVIEPLDEMDNTPWSAALLDWLAADFRDTGSDLKHLIRTIMTSRTYQLPSVTYEEIADLQSNDYRFRGPVRRRLSAEQFADAISQVIAPVYYATAFDPEPEDLAAQRIWFREIEFDRDVLPKPGKRYFRHVFSLPKEEIRRAQSLISVDHSFKLLINDKPVSEGTDWRKVQVAEVQDVLQAGKNIIAVEGTNEGSIPNPAGLLFALQIQYASGATDTIFSHTEWKSTNEPPADGWTSLNFDDSEWKESRNYGTKHWGKLVDFTLQANTETPRFARASLVQLDPFLKALGRPTRENVATSRDDQATLLQALELTNGEFFNQILTEGAERWMESGTNSESLVQTLYHQALGRHATEEESKVLVSALGEFPDDPQTLQDILWATLLLPEFQFIY
ncbi:MAG: DUF1553 domain-containing protein [Cyclobacteriaceae bacterium]